MASRPPTAALPRPDGFGPGGGGFAAARNESFRHLTTTHAIWLDSDDFVATVNEGRRVLATPSETATALHSLVAGGPNIDLWLVDYVYQTDEFGNAVSVLAKERLLRLGASWRWR